MSEHEEHPDEVPGFDLPEWGSEGAPAVPYVDEDDADSMAVPPVDVRIERRLLVTTMPLPVGWTTSDVKGLVTGTGSVRTHKSDGTRRSKVSAVDAVRTARDEAMDGLRTAATAAEANAVVGLRLSVSSDDHAVVVLAYGTAVVIHRS